MYTYNVLLSEEDRLPFLVKEREFCAASGIVDVLVKEYHARNLPEEHVWVAVLDKANQPVSIFDVSHGTTSASYVSPKEVFMRAILCGAKKISIIHNHPSGTDTPSKQDHQVAERFGKAGEILGIEVYDFIIIGKSYCSFREEHLI